MDKDTLNMNKINMDCNTNTHHSNSHYPNIHYDISIHDSNNIYFSTCCIYLNNLISNNLISNNYPIFYFQFYRAVAQVFASYYMIILKIIKRRSFPFRKLRRSGVSDGNRTHGLQGHNLTL